MGSDANGHEWRIGRFQTDDESECRLCGIVSDSRQADEPCERRGCGPLSQLHRFKKGE